MYTLSLQPKYFYLHDIPRKKSSQEILENYIRGAYTLFSARASLLTDFETPFEGIDKRNLLEMLDLLVEARTTWEEESE